MILTLIKVCHSKELSHANNTVHGRANFMAHIGKKFRFCALCIFSLLQRDFHFGHIGYSHNLTATIDTTHTGHVMSVIWGDEAFVFHLHARRELYIFFRPFLDGELAYICFINA